MRLSTSFVTSPPPGQAQRLIQWVEARLARLAVVVVTSQHPQSGKRTYLPRSFLHFHRHLLPAPGTLLRIVVVLAASPLQPGSLQRLGLGFQRQLHGAHVLRGRLGAPVPPRTPPVTPAWTATTSPLCSGA